MKLWAALLVLALSGCFSTQPDEPVGPVAAAPDVVPIECRVMDEDGEPIRSAACQFVYQGFAQTVTVDASGVARIEVPRHAVLDITASSPGYENHQFSLVADAPHRVTITLLPAKAPPTSSDPEPEPGPKPKPVVVEPVEPIAPKEPITQRQWSKPVVVTTSGNEPHLTGDASGNLYYSPTSDIFRSQDGGATWHSIAPSLTEALPILGGDTSTHVAPDGSLWWSRYWGYAGGTIGCTSIDQGDSWTCDNTAIPGATDRMWIVGIDKDNGYLQTNQGLYHHVWAVTESGSLKYQPHATSTALLAVRNGNMVYDEVNDAVWQIEFTGGTQKLMRIDTAVGLVNSRDTGVPATYALPWLSVNDGVLWTTGEPAAGDGTRSVLAARSMDAGVTWKKFPIESAAASVSFSYIGAGPDGRVAIVYYGSDKPGPSTENGGTWSVYVAETDNGLDPNPVWVETKIVDKIHQGNICIGLNCEDTGDDPEARFSGDLIGMWVDFDGNAHVAYNDDASGGAKNGYIRQFLA